ncbi:MAG: type II secretion system protein [Verrucomicrobiota bacterium]
MTSAIGSNLSRKSAGFTLIEIVFAIGLIAVATAIVVVNAISMIDRSNQQTTEEVLFAAIKEARFKAAADRGVTELRFNKELGSLQISNKQGANVSFDLDKDFAERGNSEIKFYLVPAAEGLSRQEDPIRTDLESEVVRFAPDRSSSPFVVEIDTGSGIPSRLAIDPFSSLKRQSER